MVWCSFPAGDRRCGFAAQQAQYLRYGLGGRAAGAETRGPYTIRIIRKAKNRLGDEILEIYFRAKTWHEGVAYDAALLPQLTWMIVSDLAHHAISMHLPTGFSAGFSQSLEETYDTLPTSETSRPKCG